MRLSSYSKVAVSSASYPVEDGEGTVLAVQNDSIYYADDLNALLLNAIAEWRRLNGNTYD